MSQTPKKNESESGRRGFFTDALREAMGPLSGMLEKKLGPVLRVIDELPTEGGARTQPQDQPHVPGPGRRALHLPLVPEHILRPPGALPEAEYETVCSRCGKCVEVCPANAINLDKNGLIADGFPYIVPAERPCVVCDELACMKHCPSGALKLVDKLAIRIGTAKVTHATCRRTEGEDCRLCVFACPIGPSAIYISETTNKVRVKKAGCIGCGLCENICPTEPRSIVVRAGGGVDVIVA